MESHTSYPFLYDVKKHLSWTTRQILSPFHYSENIMFSKWWRERAIIERPDISSRFSMNEDEWQEEKERIAHDQWSKYEHNHL